MKKCEMCGADATLHVTEVDASDLGQRTLKRNLCNDCARKAGLFEEPLELTVYQTEQLAEFLRTYRRMPTQHERMWLSFFSGASRQETQEGIDAWIERLDELSDIYAEYKQFPSEDETAAGFAFPTKRLAEFLRTNRRMPTLEEKMELCRSTGTPRHHSAEEIDAYIQYLDDLMAFVEIHKRLPTDEELSDPFSDY